MRKVLAEWVQNPVWKIVLLWKVRAREGDEGLQRRLLFAGRQLDKSREAAAMQRMRMVMASWVHNPVWRLVLIWRAKCTFYMSEYLIDQLPQSNCDLRDRGPPCKSKFSGLLYVS